jgi:hypothetical protein
MQLVLDRVLEGQRRVLGDALVGSYLFGSAATGSFEPGISDVDTVAVLRSNPTDAQLGALAGLHRAIVEEMPQRDDRVETVYLTLTALRRFRSGTFPAARVSPGEPFHAIEVDPSWLIDWYQLRSVGIALAGPPPSSVAPEISHEEYVEAVRRHLLGWSSWADIDSAGGQSYAILTACRAFRTVRTGEHVSKREAAAWASDQLPEDAPLIERALLWRERARIEPAEDLTGDPEAARSLVERVGELARDTHRST